MFLPATARPAPEWLRSGTIYEIYPRDFSVAGNLAGVTAKLDELKDLGVTILWTMPIHPIGEKFRKGEFGSPYSIKNYYAVDPNYGTLDDYKKFVAAAHQRGLKVIMDLVANHTAWDSVMMTNKGFYKQDANGHVIPPVPDWDGCRRFELSKRRAARIHDRDAEVLDPDLRRGRFPLRRRLHGSDRFLGTSPR